MADSSRDTASVRSDATSGTSAKSGDPASPKSSATTFKVSDVRDNDVVLLMEDGRAFTASVKEGVEGIKRKAEVVISSDGETADGVPKSAEVTGVKS